MESWKADEKQRDEVESEERRCKSAKVRREKIHPRQILEKSRNAVFFQWFVCRVSRTVGSLKRRVRSHVVRGEIKNCTPLWREAHFEVKMVKSWGSQSTFWSSDVEKLHAAVARSTFSSENVQNTSASDHFLKYRCRKIARRCGEKYIFEVKMLKCWGSQSTFWSSDVEKLHAAWARNTRVSENNKKLTVSEHFLMSKNCMPLWREAQIVSQLVS